MVLPMSSDREVFRPWAHEPSKPAPGVLYVSVPPPSTDSSCSRSCSVSSSGDEDYSLCCPPVFYNPLVYPAVYPAMDVWRASLELEAHRLQSQETAAKQMIKKRRPKKYSCECGTSFSNRQQLVAHGRIHSGERPFACSEPGCDKRFTRNEELTRHKKIHTGVKPFKCEYCQKQFGRKDHLKKHVKTHDKREAFLPAAGLYYPSAGYLPLMYPSVHM